MNTRLAPGLLMVLAAWQTFAAAETGTPARTSLALDPVWSALEASGYDYTPAVQVAFLNASRAHALTALQESGQPLPDGFVAWVDADPEVAATVYGVRSNAASVLQHLAAMEIDLGAEMVRSRYRSLALALAVTHARKTPPDLRNRPPFSLTIPGDPRQPVDTKAKDRTLDVNDHIINFLEDHPPIEEDVVVGQREEPEPLRYDERGIAIPAGKPRKVPVTERRARPLIAADVFASRALQESFNHYLAERGFTNRIDCGDGIIHRNRRDMIRGPEAAGIRSAYLLFRGAYESKGRLPAQRDAAPTPSEKLAFLARNDRHVFPDDLQAQRKWPRFPLQAPWPLLTLLAADDQPLREREDLWLRFRDKGQVKTYGEYIGGIAQQFDFQSARRLSPFAYTYGSFQMMEKDGGVCGTMAGMGVRTHIALGIPACTAGQPGHCALIRAIHDPKTGRYRIGGEQYATGGDDKTSPHGPYVFGDVDGRRGMVYHQSVAWAVNLDAPRYLDALVAQTLYGYWPATNRAAHAARFLGSVLQAQPFSILAADALVADVPTALGQIAAWTSTVHYVRAAAERSGCPTNGLYDAHLRTRMFARLEKLPLPEQDEEAAAVLAFLERERCDAPRTLVRYEERVHGAAQLIAGFRVALTSHLARVQTRHAALNETEAAALATRLSAIAERVKDPAVRKSWARSLLVSTKDRECFHGSRYRPVTDPVVIALYRLAGERVPDTARLYATMMDRVAGEMSAALESGRTVADTKVLAARVTALAGAVKDPVQLAPWRARLAKALEGREEFVPVGAKPGAKPVRDPCVDAVSKIPDA